MAMRDYLVLALICAPAVLAETPPQPPGAESAAEDILFADLPQVEAASLHAQSLAEAPANVSVITAEEVRRYGYRTLGEALASVRGFYVTNDHSYEYVGVRGFSLPGDFNTRFLVMLNGHPLTDNIYNSNNFFEQDFGLDMDLVERIEIIRGPTSALYGSNGMLANINVVTRSPAEARSLGASVETSSAGGGKLSLTTSRYLGNGVNLLAEASVFQDQGFSFPVAGLPVPAGVGNTVSAADGESGFHSFANLVWRGWSFTAYFNERYKNVPIGLGTSLSGDAAQHVVDSRNLIEASYKRQAGPGQLQWRMAYDQYRYRDLYDYPVGDVIEPVRDVNKGDWLDSSLTYDIPLGHVGPLTMGASGSWELRNVQYNLDDDGVIQDWTSRPDRGLALFAQQEWDVSRRWKLYGGARWDYTRYFPALVSPRVAAVFQASPRTVYKLVYGHPFRNPSSFEQFYNDGGLSYVAAAPLKPEAAQAFEASFERRMARNWTVILNGFHDRIKNVIEAVTLADGVQQYQNAGKLLSTGVEFEVRGKLWNRLETTASTAWQNAVDGSGGGRLANAPSIVSKARLGLPVGHLFLGGSVNYLSPRDTWSGATLGGFLVADGTATVRLGASFDLQAGIRNALNKRYEDPIYLAIDRLPGDPRSAFLRLVWHPWE
jgi:outer membrane receptor for ferrienterochelin and colicins